MGELTHLSLFSGIGGLDLAAEWAGFRTVGQCEWADYPRKVLEKHWPDVPKWRDICEFTANDFFRRTGCLPGGVTCISGGFPCQPHSIAGKRKASCDERDLWPEFRRVVSEIRPQWVVAENVRGLLSSEGGRFFLGILRDFAELGYDVGWGITSAAAVGAIHKRERIAIVARNTNSKQQGAFRKISQREKSNAGRVGQIDTDHNGFRLQRRLSQEEQQKADEQFEGVCIHLLQRADAQYISKSAILRGNNGISKRVDRTKSLGNSVVPQQFYPIFQAIAEIEAQL